MVIAADPMFRDRAYQAALGVASEEDLLKQASAMFGTDFADVEQLKYFLRQFSTVEEVVAKLSDPKRFLFDSEWTAPPPDQFARYLQHTTSQIPMAVRASVPEMAYQAFFGRMMQANELLFRSARYSGTPLIDAPTSWQYLLWKYEYDGESPGGTFGRQQSDAVICKAIAAEGHTEFGMLSGVPAEALIELRRNGAMGDLRERIRGGVRELDLASADSLSKVADHVIATMDDMFAQHEKQLKDVISSRKKFFGLDVSRWIVTGGVSVAAALTQNPRLAVLAAAAPPMLGAPSIPDLRRKWRELQTTRATLSRSPSAILFRHLGPKFGFPSD